MNDQSKSVPQLRDWLQQAVHVILASFFKSSPGSRRIGSSPRGLKIRKSHRILTSSVCKDIAVVWSLLRWLNMQTWYNRPKQANHTSLTCRSLSDHWCNNRLWCHIDSIVALKNGCGEAHRPPGWERVRVQSIDQLQFKRKSHSGIVPNTSKIKKLCNPLQAHTWSIEDADGRSTLPLTK